MPVVTKKGLTIAIAAALAAPLAMADGRLEGRIVAADNTTNLEGATVRLTKLGRTVTSSRDGRYAFAGVPAGEHELVVSYLGAQPTARRVDIENDQTTRVDVVLGASLDEIVVTGTRGGQASALNQQRASDSFVSVVSADSIGALPDTNVAEAVQRVPGVFLERDQGEGRYIGIRGMDPNLNTTLINGSFVPAPDSGARSVALDVIPSDLLEGLEVRKSFTPDMEAGAIGGTVNVRSLSAFDREGRSLSLSAEGGFNNLVDDYSPKIAASYTDVFDLGDGEDNFGIAAAASWFDRDFGSDNFETGGWPNDLETVAGDEFKGLEEFDQRSYSINRERIGAVLNFDWRSDFGTYYLRNLYSVFSDQEYRTANTWKLDDGEAVQGNADSALWDGATIEKTMKDRLEEQEIFSVLLGGENSFDTWLVEYSLAHSHSEEREPDRLDTTFELEGVTAGYSGLGEVPKVIYDSAMDDPDNFALAEFEYLDGLAEDTSDTARFDITKDLFNTGYSGSLKFGALYRQREKTYDAEIGIYEDPAEPTLAPFADMNVRYGLGPFGPGIEEDVLRNYFFSNRASFDFDDEDSAVESTAGDYTLNEDVTAAYIMSDWESGNLRLVYGLRWEGTAFDASGVRFVTDDINGSGDPAPSPVSFSKDYANILPSVTLRYETGDIVWRAAASQTVARPNFSESSPGGEIEFETDGGENVLKAETGNPELDPVESINLDLGVEWYPGGVSTMSAGLFYKKIDNFIVYADVAGSIDLSQFVGNTPVDDAEVIQPINGDSADLFGVELAYLRQFDNGLYLSANGTYIHSEASYPDRDGKSDLPRTPDFVVNGAIGWETDMLGLRLAATYRDDALSEFDELDDPDFDIYQDAHLQVDLSGKWNITGALQVYLSANNLTDEPYYRYFGSPRYNAQFEEYGRTYAIGLRFAPN